MNTHTQEAAKAEIKECPFCGGIPELIARGNDYAKSRSAEIICKPCGVKVIVAAIRNNSAWCQSKVVEKWNNRTGQATQPIAADAEEAAKIFAGTNYTKNHFPRRYQDRIDGFLAGYKAGYASQPKGAGVKKPSEKIGRCKTCGHKFDDDVCCADCIDKQID